MLLVESPFAGSFFAFKRFIENVLKFFQAFGLPFCWLPFPEVPSFSGQFERKIQNLEWGPLDH